MDDVCLFYLDMNDLMYATFLFKQHIISMFKQYELMKK